MRIEESGLVLNLGCRGTDYFCSDRRGAAAGENPLDRLLGRLRVVAQPSVCTRDAGSRLRRGKNIGFVYRTAEGERESLADFAAELVRLKVDIIVADSTDMALALKKATSTIPIVMTSSTDPVGAGLVTSLARPGGNVTGLTSVAGELGGKFLELLKETVPKLTRAAILRTETLASDIFVKEAEVPARALGVQLIPVVVQGPDDIDDAFRAIGKERINGLVMRLPPSGYSTHFKRVAELTMKNRLPSIALQSAWTDAGGLMSYGPDFSIGYRRAATYVDKILKGAKPANLPVEAPTKFEWIINSKTARLDLRFRRRCWRERIE